MTTEAAKLYIAFHGRVIEHLGIDMYQSPVAAIAELVSNSWDADARRVTVSLPDDISADAEIVISDTGEGMSLKQCQDRYLKVGYNRRKDRQSEFTVGGRPVMGRKGIGKFAGFGIANLVVVDTVSRETGERTVFKLDVARLTGESDGYASETRLDVEVVDYSGPNESMRKDGGTTIYLRNLTLKKRPNSDQFRLSMARRFLLLERSDEFEVLVDGKPIADEGDVEKIQFSFPADYAEGEAPAGLTLDGGWGVERLSNGEKIRWQFHFYRDPIHEEELAGISIFSHHKLSQRPFFFNLSGGIGGQQGTSYLSGRIEADFIDDQEKDLISTERQRINWEADAALPLAAWGQDRVKALLRIWQDRRAESKVKAMNARIEPFSQRLGKLERHERKIVNRALTSLARVAVISDEQFEDLANAILSAWEGGRLRDLIDDLGQTGEMDADALVRILIESRAMNALHAAERVKIQLNLLEGLEQRIKNRELENAVRDYIAENPWMISPEWDTFKVEKSLENLMKMVGETSLDTLEGWKGRVDLVLCSGHQLLVIEFMRPGVTADWDHVGRFERYIFSLREAIIANRGGDFTSVTGLMVADRLERPAGFTEKLAGLRRQGMDATDWAGLLGKARSQWQEYFDILFDRAPEDGRMQALAGAGTTSTESSEDQ
ncbi:ATP-binding protein [Streptomyces flavochromogenes]|uniref:ATP-binding protein n=1 Tax=Streptomyces flavochromogenes TaxID=68199 RepID=UPI0004C04457|nr:ATP-binding protein [Streptomyces flavochromogenes]